MEGLDPHPLCTICGQTTLQLLYDDFRLVMIIVGD